MDKKAKKILLNKFWDKNGWKNDTNISLADFEYCKSKGVMFDSMVISHKKLGEKIESIYLKIDKQEVVNFFISSLSTRRLDYRSFISSYAIARVFKAHKYESIEGRFCKKCGIYDDDESEYDLNILNFEKIKWGGVRLEHIDYVLFDLEQFLKLEKVTPKKEDYEILNKIKEIIINSSENDRPRQLERKLRVIIKSNAYERETILNILGICGIMETDNQKGFFENFILKSERELRPVSKTDWSYPVDWWQGKFGINEKAWDFYFKKTGCNNV